MKIILNWDIHTSLVKQDNFSQMDYMMENCELMCSRPCNAVSQVYWMYSSWNLNHFCRRKMKVFGGKAIYPPKNLKNSRNYLYHPQTLRSQFSLIRRRVSHKISIVSRNCLKFWNICKNQGVKEVHLLAGMGLQSSQTLKPRLSPTCSPLVPLHTLCPLHTIGPSCNMIGWDFLWTVWLVKVFHHSQSVCLIATV